MTKNLLVLIFLFFLIFNASSFVLAQSNSLELTYPKFLVTNPPTSVKTDIAQYFRYIYYAALGISGFLVLAALLYSGFRYLTSAGNPTVLQDAKNQLFMTILGILILFGSWIILSTINPQLVSLKPPVLTPYLPTFPSGIYLCKSNLQTEFSKAWDDIERFKKKEKQLETASSYNVRKQIIDQLKNLSENVQKNLGIINEKCYLASGSGEIREDFTKSGNEVTDVFSVPKEIGATYTTYGAFLFEKPDFKGKKIEPQSLVNGNALSKLTRNRPVQYTINNKPRSVLTFIVNKNLPSAGQVIAYEELDFNKGFAGSKKEQSLSCNKNVYCNFSLSPPPKSIRMPDTKPGYIAILSKSLYFFDPVIITNSQANLLSYEQIIDWDCTLGFFRCEAKPAASHIILISASIY